MTGAHLPRTGCPLHYRGTAQDLSRRARVISLMTFSLTWVRSLDRFRTTPSAYSATLDPIKEFEDWLVESSNTANLQTLESRLVELRDVLGAILRGVAGRQ